ncbi:ATP-binding cassette domain-containing protein [Acetobacter sp.]
MPPLLSLRDLAIDFPARGPGTQGVRPAVTSIGFDIPEGGFVALVGESGSGKSLTALSLLGLLPPGARRLSGTAIFENEDIFRLEAAPLRALRGSRIGMIFQEPMTSLNPVLTVGSQIAEVLYLHLGLPRRAAQSRTVELLDAVRINDPRRIANAYPHELSGGMRQRVMIAMAIACHPRLLIADEPTTALDVTIQAQILELIDSLRAELSMAVLLITHDLDIVAQWADRAVIARAGQVVEALDASRLFTHAQAPYTRALLAASPRQGKVRHYTDGPLTELPAIMGEA